MSVLNLFGGRTPIGVEIRNGSDAGSSANFSMNESTSVTLFAEILYSDGTTAPYSTLLAISINWSETSTYLSLSGMAGNQATVNAAAVPSDQLAQQVSLSITTAYGVFNDTIDIDIINGIAVFDHVEIRTGSNAGSPADFSLLEGSSVNLFAVEVYSDSSFIPCTGTINWSEVSVNLSLSAQSANQITVTAGMVGVDVPGNVVNVDNVSVGTDSISITVTDTPIPDYAPFLVGDDPWLTVNSIQLGNNPAANASAVVGDLIQINWTINVIDNGQPDGTASYIFYRNGSPIQSGANSDYLVVGADVGTTITGRVTVTNYLGSATILTDNSVSVS